MTTCAPEDMDNMAEGEDIITSPEDMVFEADVKNTLGAIMEKLPEEQRIALFLFYYEEMTVKEIAQIFQCSESTIKSRLTYARKFMRKEVEKCEDEGYKLRCIIVLPFLYALFCTEKNAVEVNDPKGIIEALGNYKGSVKKGFDTTRTVVLDGCSFGDTKVVASAESSSGVSRTVASAGSSCNYIYNLYLFKCF